MTSNLDDDDTTPSSSSSPSYCNHNHTHTKQYCILFYKYHPLTDQPHILETYRQATETLCTSLNLTGRILIGLSNNGEGVNGTLAGSKHDLDAYVHCMLGKEDYMDDDASLSNNNDDDDDDGIDERIRRRGIIAEFRSKSKQFFNRLNLPELFLASPNDFKWSSSSSSSSISDKHDTTTTNNNNESWFPDLNVKITKEIISTGGAFADISTKDTSVGYLTPKEWHEEIQSLITNKHNNNSKKKKEEGGNDTTETSSSSSKDEKDDEEQVETILIDVRNHKECQIGSFAPGISIDPQTKTFAQFPQWVKNNVHVSSASSSTDKAAAAAAAAKSVTATTTPPPSLLNNKRILMYCTGGIRCEKASAYIRQIVPENKGIYHLKGGIHKYLEEFGPDSLLSSNSNTNNNNNSCTSNTEENDKDKKEKGSGDDQQCLFVGKNFVFDRRGALDTKGHGIEKKAADGITTKAEDGGCGIIGKCQYCNGPYDTFRPENICTVCREPVLVCDNCQLELCQEQKCLRGLADDDDDDAEQQGRDKYRAELHCEDHAHLKACYFTSLVGFDENELEKQLKELKLHHKELEPLRKKGKQKRRTIRKQMDKLQTVMERGGLDSDQVDGVQCRHCGSATCASDCWGFHGGNTRMMNKNKKTSSDEAAKEVSEEDIKKHKQRTREPSKQRPAKRMKREKDLSEIETLRLSSPPSQHRNDATGLRVPPPVVRVLRSGIKGKWCGQTVHWVMNNIFAEGSHDLSQQDKDARLEQLIAGGMIRINGNATSSSATVLQNMDTIERIVHWHEPPVSVPSNISLTKHTLPKSILASSEEPGLLYCIDKPSTVPIYPAGPYYSNSLLMMVEAQEGLPPKSLIPLHRIDRATSGVLLCTNTSSVARIVQGRMTSNSKADDVSSPVKKLYLARVEGKFPSTSSESPTIPEECASCASFSWHGGESNIIEVNAPIAVQLESESKSSGKQEDRDTSNAMMHRTVRSDGGKDSTSRFKLVSYDPSTNQSLVACCPITGRGHQLRVHLQLIGFPIHNDVEYGGTIVNEEKRNEQENAAAQSMLDVAAATKDCLHEDSVSSDEVKSAVKLCKCCNSGLVGVRESLNSAQLLGCGHEIDLHAHKYRMTFEQKDGSRFNDKEQMQSETSMEFATDLPSWAASFGTDSSSLTWLN